jgi:hypothetical protein
MHPVIVQSSKETPIDPALLGDYPYPMNLSFGHIVKPSQRKGIVVNGNEALQLVRNKPEVLRMLKNDGMEVPEFMPMDALFANGGFSVPALREFQEDDDALLVSSDGKTLISPDGSYPELMRFGLRPPEDFANGSVLKMPSEYQTATITGAPKYAGKFQLLGSGVDVDIDPASGILCISGAWDTAQMSAEAAGEFLKKRTLEALDMLGLDYGSVTFAINEGGIFIIDVHPRLVEDSIPSLQQYLAYLASKKK